MVQSMLAYIQKSPDCFHAVEALRRQLLEQGYTQLTEGGWTLEPGGAEPSGDRPPSSLRPFKALYASAAGFFLASRAVRIAMHRGFSSCL